MGRINGGHSMIQNKLLGVIDMQNDFLFGTLANKAGVAIIPQMMDEIRQYREEGNTVIFTRDTHDENYLETEEGKNLPVPHCIKGTKGWEITDYLKEFITADTKVFDKSTFGSSKLFNYLAYLRESGHVFDEIKLVGVCTDICVIANAIIAKTACPNTHIVVDASLCAGVTPESHEIALKAMEALHIEVIHKGEEIWKHIDLTHIQ